MPDRFDSREVATVLGIEHDALFALIQRHEKAIEQGGAIRFRVSCTPGEATITYAVLTAEQAVALRSLIDELSVPRSAIPRLRPGARPIDRVAARVAFGAGDHPPRMMSDNGTRTMMTPPREPARPIHVHNYQGARRGRFTAVFWWSGKSHWLVRCACGAYEFRNVAGWDSPPPDDPTNDADCCSFCRRERSSKRGGNSRERTAERLMAWIRQMRLIGLSDSEIEEIRRHDHIATHGKSADEIRAQMAAGAQTQSNPIVPNHLPSNHYEEDAK